MKSKMRVWIFMLVLVLFGTAFAACQSNTENSDSSNSDSSVLNSDSEDKLIDGTGGDLDLTRNYGWEYNSNFEGVDGGLINLANESNPNAFDEWLTQFEFMGGSRDRFECSYWNFIYDMGFTKEQVVEATQSHRDLENGMYTLEQIDAILSDDEKFFNEQFYNPRGFCIDGIIYTPKWIAENEPEAYAAVGITKDMMAEKLAYWNEYEFFSPENTVLLQQAAETYINS